MTIARSGARSATANAFWLGVAAYIVPTFPIAFAWHLSLFADRYEALGVYRADMIFPLGLAAMSVQGMLFSWIYPRIMDASGPVLRNGLIYGSGLGLLSWTFTTLAVAAKHVMTSVPEYLVLETGFTILQFAVAGPIIAWAHKR